MMDEKTYLTQEEVDALPIGTQIEVVWTGGNGPHIYTIDGKFGKHNYCNGGVSRGYLDFVGCSPPFTTVKLTGIAGFVPRNGIK